MADGGIEVLLFDVGGVLLTNGWDRYARRRASDRFGFDPVDYDDRHDAVADELDEGRLSLDQYLDRTIFCQPRDFSREKMVAFMREQSQPHPETLALARRLAASGRYLMATLNNESTELNRYRIDTFGLAEIFSLFFSSCYLGVRKPDARVFEIALGVTQCGPKQCLFVDDRPYNVEAAREAGLYAVQHRGDGGEEGAQRLLAELAEFGIHPDGHGEEAR